MPPETLTLPQTNHYTFTDEDRAKSATVPRRNPRQDLLDCQKVLKAIVTGAIRWHNGEQVIDIPAREIATCVVALTKAQQQQRMIEGKANPAPVKSEPKRGKRSSGALRPAVIGPEPTPAPTSPEPVQSIQPGQS